MQQYAFYKNVTWCDTDRLNPLPSVVFQISFPPRKRKSRVTIMNIEPVKIVHLTIDEEKSLI